MIYIYFAVLLLLLIVSFVINKKDFASPAFIFTFGFFFQGIWVLFYYKQWNLHLHLNTFLVITLSILEFIIVTYLVKLFMNKKYKSSNTEETEIKRIKINYVLEILYFLFIVGVGALYLYHVVKIVNGNFNSIGSILKSISDYDTLIKFEADLFNAHVERIPFIVNNLNYAVVAAGYWFLYVVINNIIAEKKVRIIEILIVIVSLLSSMLSGSRTPIFMMIVAGICYYFVLLFKKKQYKNIFSKKIVITVLCIGIAFLLSFAPIAKLLGREINLWSMNYLAIYCGAEVKNLDSYLQEREYLDKNKVFGSQTFYSIIQTLGNKLHIKGNEYRLDLRFRRANGLDLGNVYTTFYSYIYDFGYIGLFIFVFLMALISEFIYEKIIHLSKKLDKPSMYILVYGTLFGCLALSFFSNKFFEELFSMGFIKKIVVWLACTLVFCTIDLKKIFKKN